MVPVYHPHMLIEISNSSNDGIPFSPGQYYRDKLPQEETSLLDMDGCLREEDYRFCHPAPSHVLYPVSSYPPSSSSQYQDLQVVSKNASLTWGPEYQKSSVSEQKHQDTVART